MKNLCVSLFSSARARELDEEVHVSVDGHELLAGHRDELVGAIHLCIGLEDAVAVLDEARGEASLW